MNGTTYEFGERENATVAHLALMMRFVGFAHVVLGAALALGVARLWPVSTPAVVVLALLAILVIVMGIHLVHAATRFRGIVAVRGRDIENLMAALGELSRVYAVQRWTFVAAALAIVFALLMTIPVR
jgi:hypothetical protein